MTADWTTCRVVRDRAGDLWTYCAGRWHSPETASFPTHKLERFGPLAPVLDADGQPVVRTVGDLTARHIGRRVRFRYSSPEGAGPEDEGVLYGMEFVRGCLSDLWVNVWLDDYGCDPFDLTLDTPCEVLDA